MTAVRDAQPLGVQTFILAMVRELDRARKKHPDEEGVLTDAEWLAVLTEEVGECARAIQDETDDHLRAELVQVATMALRWSLSIPHGRQRPPWAGRPESALPPDVEDLARALAASHSLTLDEAVDRLTGATPWEAAAAKACETQSREDAAVAFRLIREAHAACPRCGVTGGDHMRYCPSFSGQVCTRDGSTCEAEPC
jgi:hypothetical protein